MRLAQNQYCSASPNKWKGRDYSWSNFRVVFLFKGLNFLKRLFVQTGIWYFPHFVCGQLTIILQMCIGCKLLDSGWGAQHQVGHHKFILATSVSGIIVLSNIKHWIKISLILFSTYSSFWPFWGKFFLNKIVNFHIWTSYMYRIWDLYRE